MAALTEVQKAVGFFSKNNPDSPELNRVRQLTDIGKHKMEEYFTQVTKQNTKVPAPESVYDLIAANTSDKNSLGPRIDSSEGSRPGKSFSNLKYSLFTQSSVLISNDPISNNVPYKQQQ